MLDSNSKIPVLQMSLAQFIGAVITALLVFGHSSPSRADQLQLIMFEQAFCEWCEAWDETIGVKYAKTTEGRIAPLRRVDIHADRPGELSEIRGVAFTPTFVVFDGDAELGRITGYINEHFFWEMLSKILADAGELPQPPAQPTGGH